jgi:hypothetical protein
LVRSAHFSTHQKKGFTENSPKKTLHKEVRRSLGLADRDGLELEHLLGLGHLVALGTLSLDPRLGLLQLGQLLRRLQQCSKEKGGFAQRSLAQHSVIPGMVSFSSASCSAACSSASSMGAAGDTEHVSPVQRSTAKHSIAQHSAAGGEVDLR